MVFCFLCCEVGEYADGLLVYFAPKSGDFGEQENDEANLFKDPKMLQRFQDISVLPEKEKECLLTTVDHFIKSAKISAM